MKIKIFALILLVPISVMLMGQNEVDALRYSQLTPNGTARFVSMGGAFGALGGDISVMSTNPAGIGVFRKSAFDISMGWSNSKVSSTFNESSSTVNDIGYQLTSIGYVVANSELTNSDWKYLNFGFSYNKLADFNFQTLISSENKTSSILDMVANNFTNGTASSIDDVYMNAYTIIEGENGEFYNDYNFPISNYGADQTHSLNSSGYMGEYDFSIAANYQNRFYLGATLGIQVIRFEQTLNHKEDPTNSTNNLKYLEVDEYLKTKGNGLNLKLGAIYKVNQMVRLGLTLHTPTVFNMRDDYYTNVNSEVIDIDNDINDIFYEESDKLYYNWKYASPLRVSGSGAFVLGKMGLISAEIEYVDYSNMNISGTDGESFSDVNSIIKELYTGNFNYKIGAEVKFGILSLRAGAVYQNSAFVTSQPNSDASKFIYSGGLGVNSGNMYFDMAYQSSIQNEKYYMYGMEEVDLDKKNDRFIFTLGFRF
ncbi:MAG: hypothetical protein JEZ09_09870 [Salinivirgaceae bacterium]|nr:hypothetical protein [Salinivirgaceae bacterium]